MKKWYQSKTIWVNILSATLGALSIFNADFLHSIGITSAGALAILGAITTFLNVILRAVTNTGIDLSGNKNN